ncbi:MAG: hypothetical protein VW270_18435 [Candidatus Poseidoniales archaeon]
MSELEKLMASFMEVQLEKKLDPVGKEDDDVDNDGDTDSSDAYLKNRRKKVSKEVEKDKEKDDVEEKYNPQTHTSVGSKQKIKPNYNTKTHRLIVKDGKVKVISRDEWKKKGAMMTKQGWGLAEETRTMKFSTFREERTAGTNYAERSGTLPPQGIDDPSPTAPEGMWDKESPKGLEFVLQHMKSDPKWEDYEDEGHKDAVKAGRAGPSPKARPGDKKEGDPSPATQTPAETDPVPPIKMT